MEDGQCIYLTKAGNRCLRPAVVGELCSIHAKISQKKANNLTHGQTAQPSTLGIPSGLQPVYQEFLQSEDPTNLKRELAQLRTLLVELRDETEKRIRLSTDETRTRLNETLEKTILKALIGEVGDDTDMETTKEVVGKIKADVFHAILPYLPEFKLDRATVYAFKDIIDTISKVAERMKKIQEGFTFRLTIDNTILLKFVKEVILENVEDGPTRRKIVDAARVFSPRIPDSQHTINLVKTESGLYEEDKSLPISLGDLHGNL